MMDKQDKISVFFIEKDKETEIKVEVGSTKEDNPTILEIAHQNSINLEGACEGALACSTCHVHIDEEYFKKLEEPSEAEEDMLDLAFGLKETSRLGCQINLTKELDGIRVQVPKESRNVS